MIFIAAILANDNPDLLIRLYIGVYFGAYFSDIVCYSIGKTLGQRLWDIPFFAKRLKKEQVAQVHAFYERFGFLTLIGGRFIPFGIRNVLTFTAGISKMNVFKFLLSDALACLISCTTFFYLYHSYGKEMIAYVQKANIIIFSIVTLCATSIFVYYKRKVGKEKNKGASCQGLENSQ